MLECNYGVPGSGKSYKAVYTIYDAFVNEKSPNYNKYSHFFCNIADFKFDQFAGRGFKLVPKDFILNLSKLRLLVIQDKEETEIIELARTLNLLDALVVWDEAQTYFSKNNDVLLWFIEYQRHLHLHVILIAQSQKRILSGYSDLSDLNFRAVPPSLRLTNSLQYKRFAQPNLAKASYIETLTLKPDPAIFALYTSGANEKPKKVIYKFVIIALVLALLVGVIFSMIASRYSSDDSNASQSVSSVSSASKPSPISTHVFTVVCVGFDCAYLGQSVPMADLNVKEKEFSIFPTLTTQISDGVFLRTYLYNDEFIKGVFNVSLSDSATN